MRKITNISKTGLYPKENKTSQQGNKIKPPIKKTNKTNSKKTINKNTKNDKNTFIQSEEDKQLEKEIKEDFKNQEKERLHQSDIIILGTK